MQVKTVPNRVHKVKGFVYEQIRFLRDVIEVDVRPRRGSRPYCSGCGRRGATYDHLMRRRFAFVPLWGIRVFLLYAMRRVDCRCCSVTVEMVPWAEGKRHLTHAYAVFLARWARRLSWQDVASILTTSWDNVCRSVARVVEYGLRHRSLDGITAIGVDEIQFRKGHRYLTVVYQIDQGCRRLLWVGRDRTAKTLLRFFRMLGRRRTAAIRFVCSDMWQPYLKVICKKASQAIHILDRFHIVARLNKAIDEVRAAGAKELARQGYEPVLKHSRWCLLKRAENLGKKQWVRLEDLMCYSLKTVRAYLLKESFQVLWEYKSYHWAGVFLDGWLKRAMRSRLEPIKKVARSIRAHDALILNWFAAKKQFSSGIVEGLNYKIKLTIRKACGYRTLEVAETAIYHALADLPEPKLTHEFC
ncbi:MAG: ISL3 family transposase [Phycisphaerales bacterium]|nr:MAG: ISL3 family transposase [Phycisphaerales bacterium]